MNRGRPRHDDILTPREWEVLNLVEAGLTNEQIAERLGISFGTAKYHVGEIISKLGVESREEAPAAARRAQAPVVPLWRLGWLRSRFVLPAIAVAVIALLLLASAVVFTDLLRNQPGSAPHGDPSDAAADFQPGDAASQADILTRAPARLTSYYYDLQVSSKPTKNDVMQTTIGVRVWYQAPNQWRIEHYSVPTGDLHDVVISDGETTWYYKVAEATYYQIPPVHQVLRRAHRGLGPLPAITFSSTWRTRATDQAITGPLRTVASPSRGFKPCFWFRPAATTGR